MLITMSIVFPAHAGMSRCPNGLTLKSASFPRSRGDEPCCLHLSDPNHTFSPLTRG